jgi:carboxymethylenebutenolidase
MGEMIRGEMIRGEMIRGEMIRLTADDVPMAAYVARPSGAGRHPGIVLLHHQDGIDSFTRDFADRLAAAGYVAIAPDNFHHSPTDMPLAERKDLLDDAQMLNDIAACVDWLHADLAVAGDRLAIMGHCMGGRTTYLGIGVHHVFRAAVSWYGGGSLMTRGQPGPSPYDRMGGIQCPVLGFFGKLDKNPSPDDMAKFDAKMTAGGVVHEFHAYDGADHGFCNFNSPRYHEGATTDSWVKMLAFLAQHVATTVTA